MKAQDRADFRTMRESRSATVNLHPYDDTSGGNDSIAPEMPRDAGGEPPAAGRLIGNRCRDAARRQSVLNPFAAF